MTTCNDDLAEEMDDDTNDGGTMKQCRGSDIDIPNFNLHGRAWEAFEWLIVSDWTLC
ncbi:hypothetical protein P692DRAFT_20754402 [Suillus brevipes Sb2]|nr:hypothetical protein P692DRAFT_20754402 [Suillus brevipes Sb2]